MTPRQRLRPPRALWAVLVCALVAYVVHLAFKVGPHPFFNDGVYNALLEISALLTLARGVLVKEERAAWLAVGLGMVAWSLGDLYWSLVVGKLADPPYPSWSDLGYI